MTMDGIDAVAVRALLDKQAIAEVLMRYSRFMDRKDWDGLASVYWPDATDDHVLYTGDVAGLIRHCAQFTVGMPTVHFLGNMLIDLDGPDAAFAETYYIAYHDMPGKRAALGRTDLTLWGRYLDRLERRQGAWRIAARTLTSAAITQSRGSAQGEGDLCGQLRTRGASKPADPLYRLHPLGNHA
jgi:hypothetical protein